MNCILDRKSVTG